MRALLLPVLLVLLSGCIPPGFTIASYAVDGVSYLGTGKSLTDHMLSDMAGRDCATWRILKRRPICRDFTPEQLAERKRNRESIRHDVGHAYIATNLDGIDVETGAGLVAKQAANRKPAAKPRAQRTTKTTVTARKQAKRDPAPLKPARVIREELPRRGGMDTKAAAQRRSAAVAFRPARTVERRAAGSRYLVFGSFRNRAQAAEFAGRHADLRPAILPVRVRGVRYYRVVVRPEGREALAAARHHLRRNGVTDAYTMRVCRPGGATAHCMKPIAITHEDGRSAVRPVTDGG